MQQSPVILDLCLRKARSGKSHDYRDAIVLEKQACSLLASQSVFLKYSLLARQI